VERAQKLADICLIGQTSHPVPFSVLPIVQKEMTLKGHLIYNHPKDFYAAVEAFAGNHDEPIGLRKGVTAAQGLRDILAARELSGKIWIDFENWD
jgi:alcohol dehydrogenase/L-iditol 2-dehydrogenase